jgi:hypothetical protein
MIKINRDKWKHFYVGIALGIMTTWLCHLYWPLQPVLSVVVSFIIIVSICYGFELFSLATGRGHYELKDALAGIIGGTLGLLAYLLFL